MQPCMALLCAMRCLGCSQASCTQPIRPLWIQAAPSKATQALHAHNTYDFAGSHRIFRPAGDTQALPGYVSFYLQLQDPNLISNHRWDCFASYTLAVLNSADRWNFGVIYRVISMAGS